MFDPDETDGEIPDRSYRLGNNTQTTIFDRHFEKVNAGFFFVYPYKVQHKTVTNNDQNYGTESGVANSFF